MATESDPIADIFVKLDNWYRYMQGKSIDTDIGMMSHSEALAAIRQEVDKQLLSELKDLQNICIYKPLHLEATIISRVRVVDARLASALRGLEGKQDAHKST